MDVINLAEEFSTYSREPRDVVDEFSEDSNTLFERLTGSLADSPDAIADSTNYSMAKWLL
jgi:gas vesicle protein